MKKAFVFKLRPTRAQAEKLEETRETCRRLYNHALAERKNAWEEEKRSVGFAAQSASLPKLKESSDFLPLLRVFASSRPQRRVEYQNEGRGHRLRGGFRGGGADEPRTP